jgi:hypothetical protein
VTSLIPRATRQSATISAFKIFHWSLKHQNKKGWTSKYLQGDCFIKVCETGPGRSLPRQKHALLKTKWKRYGCLVWFALQHAQAAQPHKINKGKITAWHNSQGLIGLLSSLPEQTNLRHCGLPTSASRIRLGGCRALNFGFLSLYDMVHQASFFSNSRIIFKSSQKPSFCLRSENNHVSITGRNNYSW